MISFFPKAYPEELIYSQLARYYVKSGYLSLAYAIEDLYVHKYTTPDIEFLNEMKPEAVSLLTRQKDMETLIQQHTMFGSYGRFLSKEKKIKAFEALTRMQGNFNNLLSMPKNQRGAGRFLRYCPVCAHEDRSQYGETYWHRIHQIRGMDVCPKHHCRLVETRVSMDRKASPSLTDAESLVDKTSDIIPCEDEREIALSEYMLKVFREKVDFQGTISAGEFLRSRLEKYHRSDSGASLDLEALYHDYQAFYKEQHMMTLVQIQKILYGKRWDFYDICQMAMFEGISPLELSKIPESAVENVRSPIFTQVSKELQVDYETVRKVGEAVLNKYESSHVRRKTGVRELAWEKKDTELLPAVRKTIAELWGDGIRRPVRITISSVTKAMNLPDKRFEKLPRCREEIQRHGETQKEYWAREVVWAFQKLVREGQPVNWRGIRRLTNMRNVDFQGCKPFLNQYIDSDTADRIRGLL